MDAGLTIADTAMTALQMKPVAVPSAGGKNMAAIEKAANEFESVFIAQFLGTMFSGIKSDGITGGGQGEEMFRSLLMNQYAEGLQAQGGFGLAAQVKAQMLKMQEG
jgi:Rod binding domain-containing protein